MKRRRHQGFTLVEVLVSLGIMTMGAMAIIALLVQIMRANGQSREMNTAMALSQEWANRLQEDAHTWVTPAAQAGAPTVPTVLGSTLYLRNVTSPPSTTFRVLPATSIVQSAAFDYLGNDVALPVSGGATYFYCAAYRANWIYFGQTMRVDLRIFWPRAGTDANTMRDWPNCDGDHSRLDPPSGSLLNNYHVLYLPSAISVTQVVR